MLLLAFILGINALCHGWIITGLCLIWLSIRYERNH